MQLATIKAPIPTGAQAMPPLPGFATVIESGTLRSARCRDMVRSKLNVRKKGTDAAN